MDGVSVRRPDRAQGPEGPEGADGHVVEIVLDRAEALNALSTAMAARLAEVCAEVAADAGVRAVVLSAAGDRAFCVGADLKERNTMTDADLLRQREIFRAAFGGVLNLPQPVIAAVHGYCYTGALELALACDYIIAAESARFADTHGKWGMSPTWGMSQRLPRRIGISRAKEMMYTGRVITGAEAATIGLAVRCVPDDELDAAVAESTGAIAANSWFTSRTDKLLLAQSQEHFLQDGLEYEGANSPGAGPDMRERLSARK
jgi:enoyl-CoA hydratase/carnithine racemase